VAGECFKFAEISALEFEIKGIQLNKGKANIIQAAFDQHPLLNFTFRPPLLLEFSAEQFDRNRRSLRQFSTC